MNYLFLILAFIISISLNGQSSISPSQNKKILREEMPNLDSIIWHYANNKIVNGKSGVDFIAIDQWIAHGDDKNVSISPNGKAFAYSIQTKSADTENDSLIVQCAAGLWKRSFLMSRGRIKGAKPGFFSENGEQYIFQNKDSLYFLSTNLGKIINAKEIESYKLLEGDRREWIVYLLKKPERRLVLMNLRTGEDRQFKDVIQYNFENSGNWLVCQLGVGNKEMLVFNLKNRVEHRFHSVLEYKFDIKGGALVLKIREKEAEKITTRLLYIDNLGTSDKLVVSDIWSRTGESSNIRDFNIDESSKQVAFIVQDEIECNCSVWYWRKGMKNAIMKVDSRTAGIDQEFYISGGSKAYFTSNNRYIVFSMQRKVDFERLESMTGHVNLLSYSDKQLHFEKDQRELQKYILAIIDVENGLVKTVKREDEVERTPLGNVKYDYVVMQKVTKFSCGERFWEKGYRRDSLFVVSLKDGTRKLLCFIDGENFYAAISPEKKYLVYFNNIGGQSNYFSYNLNTGKLYNISKAAPPSQFVYKSNFREFLEDQSCGVVGWLDDEKGFLVYDNNDIWLLDLEGKIPPKNVTNSIGKKNQVVFSLLSNTDRRNLIGNNQLPVLNNQEPLLLKALNTQNKEQGFYHLTISKASPEKLIMGAFKFTCVTSALEKHPFRAFNNNTLCVVKKESYSEMPNYFLTKDFKSLTPLTSLQPQKKYNWLISELHSFTRIDGTIGRGILYKPENFDSAKKYPVVMPFYTTHSEMVYDFPIPAYISYPCAPMDSPSWLTSQGYLVFVPDIYFYDGQWGPSTVCTIEGAIEYLKKLSFVNGRFGGAGHSNSGRFGHYVLTHSKVFDAMCVGSGTSNPLSQAFAVNFIGGSGSTMLNFFEERSVGSGLGNFWENKERWLDHASSLHANEVTAPLLLFDNKNDGAYMPGRGLEMFLALHRLGKKVWWPQYDQGGHTLGSQKDQRDFTIRYTQFFDHYLKNAPPPHWMTTSILQEKKESNYGYELDATGSCGMKGNSTCNVCNAWNKQYERDTTMFSKPISEWKLDKDIELALEKAETNRHNDNMKGQAQRIKENNEKLKGTWQGKAY